MKGKQYNVSYRDIQSGRHNLQTFAKDSFEARIMAMQMVSYLGDHPGAIDSIALVEG